MKNGVPIVTTSRTSANPWHALDPDQVLQHLAAQRTGLDADEARERNAVIGFVQEGKAERALEAVRAMLASHATVMRDGRAALQAA